MTFIPSFNTNIMPRDAMGNIELQTSSSTNTLLIVDTYDERITKKYAVRFLDTQFQYFKFPATTIVSGSNLNINLDAINLQITDDILFARYKPSANTRITAADQGWYDAQPTNVAGTTSGYYGATPGVRNMAPIITTAPNTVGNASLQLFYNDIKSTSTRGTATALDALAPAPFDSVEGGNIQLSNNGYKITQAIKTSGKDLRFRINLQHQYESGTDLSTPTGVSLDTAKYMSAYYATSSVQFTIIKEGPSGTNKTFRGPFTASNAYYGYEPLTATIKRGQVHTFKLDTIITNSEFQIGDTFKIGIVAKRAMGDANSPVKLNWYFGSNTNIVNNYAFHTINSNGSYWVVTDASVNVDEWNNPIVTAITGSTNTTGSGNPIVISGNTGTGNNSGTTTGNTNVGG